MLKYLSLVLLFFNVSFGAVSKNEIPANSPSSLGTLLIKFSALKKTNPYPKTEVFKHNFNNGLFTIWKFKKGAFVPVHKHDTDQITYMLKGKVKITQGSDKKEFIFQKGDTFVLPAGIYHFLEALQDAEMVGVNPATVEGKSSQFTH
jgi:quercetin dioxygenase-like cupin family protein